MNEVPPPRSLRLPKRTFDQELAAEWACPDATGEASEAAVPGGDVHDGADPPTVAATEASGVDVGVGDDVRVEHAEQANAVEGIVDDHAVQQDLVLDGRATADVELTALVSCGDETGQGLQHLHEVRRAAEAGNAFDVRRLDGFYRHANRVELFAPFGGNDRALQLDEPASSVMLRVTTRSSSTTTSVRKGLYSTLETTKVYVPAGTLDRL